MKILKLVQNNYFNFVELEGIFQDQVLDVICKKKKKIQDNVL
jgi:hypothetical protein